MDYVLLGYLPITPVLTFVSEGEFDDQYFLLGPLEAT